MAWKTMYPGDGEPYNSYRVANAAADELRNQITDAGGLHTTKVVTWQPARPLVDEKAGFMAAISYWDPPKTEAATD